MSPVHKRLLGLATLVGLGALLVVGGAGNGPVATAVAGTDTEAGTTADRLLALQWSDLLPDGAAVSNPSDTREAATADPGGMDLQTGPMPERNETEASFDPEAPRRELHGRRVELAGYMTPLNVMEGETRVFLLVPYVGACVHVPAPPANQIVLVESEEPVAIREMWDPFKAVGRMRVEFLDTGLAEVSYTMELERIDPFDFEKDGVKLEGVRSANDGD